MASSKRIQLTARRQIGKRGYRPRLMRTTLGETGSSNVTDSRAELWRAFLSSGCEPARAAASAVHTSWQFGYGVEQGDRLLDYVLSGAKRATAGALRTYEREGEAIPRPGDFSTVTDGSGIARCIIRTITVDIVSFDQVDERFAYDEGEGDLTLAYWRAVHWDFFVRELAGFGEVATPDMPVVCERFEVVFPLEAAARTYQAFGAGGAR